MEMLDIDKWASSDIKTITVTQDVSGTSYDIKVREFVPVAGDAMARRWVNDSVEQFFECTPYGIADMREGASVLSDFVDRTMESSLCFYTDESDKLIRNTYSMAYRCSKLAEVSMQQL